MRLTTDITSIVQPGKRARAIRLHRGLTQLDVSAEIGIDNTKLSRFENGWYNRLDEFFEKRLCELLGVEHSDIWVPKQLTEDA